MTERLPKRWSTHARAVFDDVYRYVQAHQASMTHPQTQVLPVEQWKTIAWNAAWVAAEVTDGNTMPEKILTVHT